MDDRAFRIQVNTEKLCVQGAIRAFYERSVKQALSFRNNEADEFSLRVIDGLERILLHVNFDTLRAEYRELDSGGNTVITIHFDADDESVTFEFNGIVINRAIK